MSRRGLTMIELLLALALLASIVSACAVWINVAASASAMAGVAASPQRDAAVQAALARIQDDLLIGDFVLSARENKPRVRVEDGELVIELRHGSRCTYRRDTSMSQLVRQERGPLRSETRPVLGHIIDFTCTIDDAERELLVTIEFAPASPAEAGAAAATLITRRYRL